MMEREDKNKAKVGIHGVLVILCNFNNLINIFNLTKLDKSFLTFVFFPKGRRDHYKKRVV